MSQNQRSAKNILVRPRQQLRLAVLFFTASSALLALYNIVVLTSLMGTLGAVVQQYDLPPELLSAFHQSLQSSVVFISIFGIVTTFGMLAIGIKMSHRIFGPQVPILGLIQKLKEGDYTARAALRKNDEFKEVMDELNALAESLQSRHG